MAREDSPTGIRGCAGRAGFRPDHAGAVFASIPLAATLLELTFVFALCVVAGLLVHRFRVPPVVGYLLAGVVVGPHSLGLVHEPELVEALAEIGVVVLLFTVGMELSLRDLLSVRRAVFVGGGVQITGTVVLGGLAGLVAGLPLGEALFLGYLLALSSTAAITKLLGDRGELAAPAGRHAVALCLAQDLAVVPMVLTIPLLAGEGGGVLGALGSVGTSLLAFGLLAVVTWLLVPRAVDIVARSRSHELFVLAVIALCLATASITGALEMSLALGAFVAGIALGSSVYRHQAASEVEPIRDALGSLFFVSIGMLFDPDVLVSEPGAVVAAFTAVVGGKGLVAWLAIRLLKRPAWLAARTALMVAQVGEFSFVLVTVARDRALLAPHVERLFLVVAVLSISATPLLFGLAGRIGRRGRSLSLEADPRALSGHAVIVGYGPAGRHLMRSLQAAGIDCRIIERNAETVKAELARGVPIVHGDATKKSVLSSARIETARLLVIATNAPEITPRIVAVARYANPAISILVRASYLSEVPRLVALDVEEIVPQELETAVELSARALRQFLVPEDEVGRLVREIRAAEIGTQRVAPERIVRGTRLTAAIPQLRVAALRVEPGSSVAGHSIAATKLRDATGLTLVAIQRGDDTLLDLGPETVLEEQDTVVGIGVEKSIEAARERFRGPDPVTAAIEAAAD